MRILLTGASGFVGRHLASALRAAGHEVRTAGYSSTAQLDFRVELNAHANWSTALEGCDAVIHAGARAHVLNRAQARSLATFADVNVAGTAALARAAAAQGVKRLVFISSIAASGEPAKGPVRETDPAQPTTPYGQSKLAAEQVLAAIRAETGLATVCLRPPLIYGPDAGGRFGQMLAWCNRAMPLPFAGIENQRSFLNVENLADAVLICLQHPLAPGEVFNVADQGVLSTPALLRLICEGLDRPCRLFALPPASLQAVARLGGAEALNKLTRSLVLDTSHIEASLGWRAPHPLTLGITAAARQYRGA